MSGLETNSIAGPAGALETLWQPAQDSTTCALLCHPHPQFGGNMHDGVLAQAAQALDDAGAAHLRFNFRGVGNSAGMFDNGVGETQDLLRAWQWLTDQNDWTQRILVGYSFGSAMAWAARTAISDLSRLILIAPPNAGMRFEGDTAGIDTRIIVGGNDSYCDTAELPEVTELTVIDGGDHFFSGNGQQLHSALAHAFSQPSSQPSS